MSAAITAGAVITELRGIVARTVEPHRARGMKAAWHAAAAQLGVSARRVRAYLNGEVRCVTAWEAEMLRAREAALLDARAARLRAELDGIEAAIAAARRRADGEADPAALARARGAAGAPVALGAAALEPRLSGEGR